jgi:predicted ArsR family transcriptional regulator
MTVRRSKPASIESTRARIIGLLRRSGLTANEIAAQLGLTHNAVRGHLAALQREQLVHESGSRRSSTRPAVVYDLLPEAEAGLSKAYIPFVAHLVRVLQARLRPAELDEVMRTVGRSLAADWPRAHGPLLQRVEGASALLEELGAPNEVERLDGGFVIRGVSTCMLAQAVHGRPDVCRAIEALVTELVDVPVRECCERSADRPRCCFEIGVTRSGTGRIRRARGAPRTR